MSPTGFRSTLLIFATLLASLVGRAELVNFTYAWSLLTKQLQGEHLTPEEQLYVDAARALPLLTVRKMPQPSPDGPRDYYVDNESGRDDASGLSGQPVKTLARATKLLRPGDTLHFAANAGPYRDTLQLIDVSGAPGHPIVIDGHGATITGSDPLVLTDWEKVGPGLFKNTRLIDQLIETNDATKLKRMYFHFDGVQQRMGRSSKGAQPAFKAPADLQPGEWTFDETERAFFIRVSGSLAEARITAPMRRCGVALLGLQGIEHVIVRNLTVTSVLNDGFNLHGFHVKQVCFENIAAYECGDDGYSPHEDVESVIDGYRASRNSTAIGNAYASVTEVKHADLSGNYGAELMVGHESITTVRDSRVAAGDGVVAVSFLRPLDLKLRLENVKIVAAPAQPIEVAANVSVCANRVTAAGLEWRINGAVQIDASVIAARRIEVLGGSWQGRGNVYSNGLLWPAGEVDAVHRELTNEILIAKEKPFPRAGADATRFTRN